MRSLTSGSKSKQELNIFTDSHTLFSNYYGPRETGNGARCRKSDDIGRRREEREKEKTHLGYGDGVAGAIGGGSCMCSKWCGYARLQCFKFVSVFTFIS